MDTEKEKFTEENERKVKVEMSRKQYADKIAERQAEKIRREESYQRQYLGKISEEERKFREIEAKIRHFEEVEKALTRELEGELDRQERKFNDLQRVIDEGKELSRTQEKVENVET